MISKILILLTLSAGVLCAWEDVKPLSNSSVNVVSYDVYLNESTGKAHFAYCYQAAANEAGKQGLTYATIDRANKVEQKAIEVTFACRRVKIIPNAKNPFPLIVVEGKRKFNSEPCSKKKTDGCVDLYILSSKDGIKWDVGRISRRRLEDPVNRISSRLIVSETGRVYLFYIQKYCTDKLGRLAFVTRSPASGSFTGEQILNYPVDDRIVDILTTGTGPIDETIHVFVEDNQKTLDISAKGLTKWSTKEIENLPEQFSRIFSKKLGNKAILIGIIKDKQNSSYRISDDDGVTWKPNVVLDDEPHDRSTVEIVEENKNEIIKILMAKRKGDDMVYKYVLPNRGIITESDLPFGELKITATSSVNLLKSKGLGNQDVLKAFANIQVKGATFPTIYFTSSNITKEIQNNI